MFGVIACVRAAELFHAESNDNFQFVVKREDSETERTRNAKRQSIRPCDKFFSLLLYERPHTATLSETREEENRTEAIRILIITSNAALAPKRMIYR